jgi:hypothetical protein
MDALVTNPTKSNEVLIGVIATTAKLLVMDVKVRLGPAVLTSPAVTLQYLPV